MIKQVEAVLVKHDAYGGLFWEIGEHAPVAGIHAAVKLFKEVKADVIVSVGGGSPIDASKAILYYVQQERGGPTPRQIAIPTTLSAAEYTVRFLSLVRDVVPNELCFFIDWCWFHERKRCQSRCELAGARPCRHHSRCATDTCNAGTSLVNTMFYLLQVTSNFLARLSTGIKALDHAVGSYFVFQGLGPN